MTPPDPLLSPAAVAERFGLTVDTLRAWRAQRSGPPYYPIGRHVRYDAAEVETFLQSKRIPA